MLKEKYKQQRQDDDLNQELSVQPWGKDGLKRKYWLIEGRDDTPFRLYRETNPGGRNPTWFSVAGTIDELKEVGTKLDGDGSQAAKRLSTRILASITRFEATEEVLAYFTLRKTTNIKQKRKKREYRLARKAAFSRPEPGFGTYEGRTRGKRMRYTYSDNEEEFYSDDSQPVRRSSRQHAIASAEYTEESDAAPSRPGNGRATRNSRRLVEMFDDEDGDHDVMDLGDDASSRSEEWQGEDEMEEDEADGSDRADDDASDNGDSEELDDRSLMVKLQFKEASSKDGLRKLSSRASPPAHGSKPDNSIAKYFAKTDQPQQPKAVPFREQVSPFKAAAQKSMDLPIPTSNNGPKSEDEAMDEDESEDVTSSSPVQPRPSTFEKFLYTPPEPNHQSGSGITPSTPMGTHSKPNGTQGTNGHFEPAAKMPTPPHTGQHGETSKVKVADLLT
jgi:hypothetical protein